MTVPMSDDLDRFVVAQTGTYAGALAELRAGRKTGHWIWFVFPQLVGLGHSPASTFYGIRGLDEARAYLSHPVLGPRLREAFEVLLAVDGRPAEAILGAIDARKVRSSATLFLRAAPDEAIWVRVLDRFYAGVADSRTDELLADRGQAGPPS